MCCRGAGTRSCCAPCAPKPLTSCVRAAYDVTTVELDDSTTGVPLAPAGLSVFVPCDSCVSITFSGTIFGQTGEDPTIVGVRLGVSPTTAPSIQTLATQIPAGVVDENTLLPISATFVAELSGPATYVVQVYLPVESGADPATLSEVRGTLCVTVSRQW